MEFLCFLLWAFFSIAKYLRYNYGKHCCVFAFPSSFLPLRGDEKRWIEHLLAPCKKSYDSLGFWIPRYRFRFQVVDTGVWIWIPFVSGIRNLELYSGFQNSGFRFPKGKHSTDSKFLEFHKQKPPRFLCSVLQVIIPLHGLINTYRLHNISWQNFGVRAICVLKLIQPALFQFNCSCIHYS